MDVKPQAKRDSDGSAKNLAAVVASLEPDQLIAAKARFRCSRRELTRSEKLMFWALRIYLVFMFGVVVYQMWGGLR